LRQLHQIARVGKRTKGRQGHPILHSKLLHVLDGKPIDKPERRLPTITAVPGALGLERTIPPAAGSTSHKFAT
jgi:hypothetical protein